MSNTIDFTKYPICDTDIWVNVCLGQMQEILFDKYGKIIVADVVEAEILRWNRTSSKFKFIAEKYNYYKQAEKILLLLNMI